MAFKVKTLQVLFLLLFVTLAIGCAGKIFADKPAKIEIRITSAVDLNPDLNGRPSPIVLRIYSLKSVHSFNGAEFFQLYDNEEGALDDLNIELLKEIEVFPDDTMDIGKIELGMETQHLGFLAAYRDLDHAVWRRTVSAPYNKKLKLHVTLGKLILEVE